MMASKPYLGRVGPKNKEDSESSMAAPYKGRVVTRTMQQSVSPNPFPFEQSSFRRLPRIILSGMTGGLSDYVPAAGDYVGDKLAGLLMDKPGAGDLSFDEALKIQRGRSDAYKDANPILGHGAELAGAITSPVYRRVAGEAARFVPYEKVFPTISKYFTKPLIQGGAVGGVAGAGYARGEEGGVPSLKDVALSTGIGTGLGGAFGAVTGPVVGMGAAGVGGLRNWIRKKVEGKSEPGPTTPEGVFTGPAVGPEKIAVEMITEAAQRGGMPASQIGAKLKQLGPQGTMADVGPTLAAVAETGAATPGRPMAITVANVRARQAGSEQRLVESMRKNIETDYEELTEQLLNKRRFEADLAFPPVFEANPIMASSTISRVLRTPSGKQGLREAQKIMQNRMEEMGRPDPNLTAALREVNETLTKPIVSEGGVAKGFNLRTLDFVRQGLQGIERARQRQVISGSATQASANAVKNVRQTLNRVGLLCSISSTWRVTPTKNASRCAEEYPFNVWFKSTISTFIKFVPSSIASNRRDGSAKLSRATL